jgi:predicted ATPase
MRLSQSLTVISFVGPSAAGKSTALNALAQNYHVLQERYVELNRHQLDNRLVLSKWAYIHYWFDAVLQAQNDGITFLLTDRCPLDTCAYVRDERSTLLAVLITSMNELAALGITVRKVLTTAPFDVLKARILSRLTTSPERICYNEADDAHNRYAYDFYSQQASLWDRVIDTSEFSQSAVLPLFESVIADIRSTPR